MSSGLQNSAGNILFDSTPIDNDFLNSVVSGLSDQQKNLPCKYFYDERGSQLFEKICATDEYYVTRVELSIYQQYAEQMAAFIGSRALIIEPGAGSVKKIGLLLNKLDKPAGFIPMDISKEILKDSSNVLATQFPEVDINPIVIDFLNTEQVGEVFSQLPKQPLANKRVIFFPGSTIGNFDPIEAQVFLKRFSDNLEPGDGLLIGVDLVKDKQVLEEAYNDKAGVTADFNLNLLHRVNNELEGEFDLDLFSHKALFNEEKSRIEMHLVSDDAQCVRVAGHEFTFLAGETIHTENSYKYSIEHFEKVALGANFSLKKTWVDEKNLFSVLYLEKP